MINNNHFDIKFVAIYVRKSRAENMDDLVKHRIILAELCKKNNLKYIEYLEVGTSDSIDMRPQISRLLKEVEEGIYDAVCVVDYDRLGRGDLGEQDRIKKAFKKSNTLILTPDKIYDLNNDIDDTYADLKGFVARQEYKMITKRLVQGKKIGARKGQWTNGTPPFPYVYERYKDKFNYKGLVVNDERNNTYRLMVDFAMKGLTPRKIASYLNQRGLRTVKGCYWNAEGIYRLLINETHLGKIISNKTQGDGHKTKRPNAKNVTHNPKSEWVIVENCHEAVKTQQEHDRIIDILKTRQKIPERSRQQSYVFSGLIKCSLCGHGMTFQTCDNKPRIKPCWYVDPLGNKCTNSGVYVHVLEEIVFKEIKRYLDSIIGDTIDYNQEDTFEVYKKKLVTTETLLEKNKKALEILNDAYEMGEYKKEQWLERKHKREKEMNILNEEIKELRTILNTDQKAIKEIRKENLKDFFSNITYAISVSERNDLYMTIIDSILWYRNDKEISIKINFK